MRRHDLLIFSLVVGGLALIGVAMALGVGALAAVGWVVAGTGAGASMVQCHQEGVIRTNWGIFRRKDNPRWFRFELGFWWTVTVLWTLGGVLCGLGVVGHR